MLTYVARWKGAEASMKTKILFLATLLCITHTAFSMSLGVHASCCIQHEKQVEQKSCFGHLQDEIIGAKNGVALALKEARSQKMILLQAVAAGLLQETQNLINHVDIFEKHEKGCCRLIDQLIVAAKKRVKYLRLFSTDRLTHDEQKIFKTYMHDAQQVLHYLAQAQVIPLPLSLSMLIAQYAHDEGIVSKSSCLIQ